MTQDATSYYVWIGGSCDYGNKERAGSAAVVVEQNGKIISKDVIADLHTTELFASSSSYASPNDAHSHGESDERIARKFRHHLSHQCRIHSKL